MAENLVRNHVGVVVIGRNEGERLRVCLESVIGHVRRVVYVDSGSTDDSVTMAKSMGALVVELSSDTGFTAARARNAGWRHLRDSDPEVEFVQFVDGDCELVDGWIELAVRCLRERRELSVVCGRRKERFPEKSVFNAICDVEWNTRVGETAACGGDSMMRMTALEAVSGFRASLIAGEEPELCLRLRRAGWKVYRLDADMTLHDAAMYHVHQWWKRSQRAGYAYAEGAWLHGRETERYCIHNCMSAMVWAAGIPAAVLLCVYLVGPALWFLLLVYPLQVLRLFFIERGAWSVRLARAMTLVLGKFAEATGLLCFLWHLFSGKQGRLIEYK